MRCFFVLRGDARVILYSWLDPYNAIWRDLRIGVPPRFHTANPLMSGFFLLSKIME
jgi:hypothetical protein